MNLPQIGKKFHNFITENDSVLNKNPELNSILDSLAVSTKEISNLVSHAGLVGILGKSNKENVQGEEVMKLDELANDILINELKSNPNCAGIASEEEETFVSFDRDLAEYIVLFDPLDGSSNIDTCASIGTIFNVFKRKSKEKLSVEDFLQKGSETVAAGYVIYGSSTILVYSAGNGVHGFTYDIPENEYKLSHYKIETPRTAKQFSINNGNYKSYSEKITQFVDWCCEENETKKAFSIRYIGSMVADFHRNLIKGGIFIYPATNSAPKGKLRLLYECVPLSFIQMHAGGLSTNDTESILDIEANALHQRTPIAFGSIELVQKYLSYQ